MLKRLLTLSLAVTLLAVPAGAEEPTAQPGDLITWVNDLPKAFARAKEKQRVLMICINAKQVDGKSRQEPAAKGLREIVYKDVRIVGKSRSFVCAFLNKGGNSADYGELRALGIEGLIVSPQHIFVHPDGDRILERKEYWSHGSGDSAVKALLAMMSGAQAKASTAAAPPDTQADPEGAAPAMPPGDDQPPAAADDAAEDGAAAEEHAKARATWILKMLKQVVDAGPEDRETACAALVKHDEKGDCLTPLIALLDEHKKNVPVLVSIVRALGVDQLKVATKPVADLLKHKERLVRGNAAVSLEYIGDPAAMKALKGRAAKEKDEAVANHMFRALGRCGANESAARALLLKRAEGSKSEFASLGPIIGLAYFDKDKKARRAVEKLLAKMGIPGGRRGGFTNIVKRGVVGLTLGQIGDEKSAVFVREKLLARLENMQSRWLGALTTFYESIVHACEGDEDAKSDLQESVSGALGRSRMSETLADEMRTGRDTSQFEPMFDWIGGGGGDGR